MLVFVDDAHVKIWFSLWEVVPKGFSEVPGKFPLEYTDSRFHRALESLKTGKYVAIRYGKTPHNSKALEINYSEADKYYSDGIREEEFFVTIDWQKIFKKFDDLKKYKKYASELELKEEIEESLAYLKSRRDLANNALLRAVETFKNGGYVPSFMYQKVQQYIAEDERSKRNRII